jgi:NifU-like protein involved in Fe-S cluster formation
MTAASTVRGGPALYTSDILALAVELAEFPLGDELPRRGEASSRVCGSKVTMALSTDADGRVARVGARVSACAIGQAAAALFLRSARGRSASDIAGALAGLEGWLAGADKPLPWPSLDRLDKARAYPARHAAILLPWKAALAALSNPAPGG